eukprot:6200052-Karenia_brevis.AAC.1
MSQNPPTWRGYRLRIMKYTANITQAYEKAIESIGCKAPLKIKKNCSHARQSVKHAISSSIIIIGN